MDKWICKKDTCNDWMISGSFLKALRLLAVDGYDWLMDVLNPVGPIDVDPKLIVFQVDFDLGDHFGRDAWDWKLRSESLVPRHKLFLLPCKICSVWWHGTQENAREETLLLGWSWAYRHCKCGCDGVPDLLNTWNALTLRQQSLIVSYLYSFPLRLLDDYGYKATTL